MLAERLSLHVSTCVRMWRDWNSASNQPTVVQGGVEVKWAESDQAACACAEWAYSEQPVNNQWTISEQPQCTTSEQLDFLGIRAYARIWE